MSIGSDEEMDVWTDIERGMLRAFYSSWVALHKIPRDNLHRHKQEAAAQLLVDRAHELKEFYKGRSLNG